MSTDYDALVKRLRDEPTTLEKAFGRMEEAADAIEGLRRERDCARAEIDWHCDELKRIEAERDAAIARAEKLYAELSDARAQYHEELENRNDSQRREICCENERDAALSDLEEMEDKYKVEHEEATNLAIKLDDALHNRDAAIALLREAGEVLERARNERWSRWDADARDTLAKIRERVG